MLPSDAITAKPPIPALLATGAAVPVPKWNVPGPARTPRKATDAAMISTVIAQAHEKDPSTCTKATCHI